MLYIAKPNRFVVLFVKILYSLFLFFLLIFGIVIFLETKSLVVLITMILLCLFLFFMFRMDLLFKVNNGIQTDEDYTYLLIHGEKYFLTEIEELSNESTIIKPLYRIKFRDPKNKDIFFTYLKNYFPLLFYCESNHIAAIRKNIVSTRL